MKNIIANELFLSVPGVIGEKANIAIYARTACPDKQKIADQISHCKEFIESNGWNPEDAAIYTDDGYSGCEENRPGYQQMLRDTEEGNFQILVICNFDRLMRNPQKLLNVLDSLSKKHIKTFIAC